MLRRSGLTVQENSTTMANTFSLMKQASQRMLAYQHGILTIIRFFMPTCRSTSCEGLVNLRQSIPLHHSRAYLGLVQRTSWS